MMTTIPERIQEEARDWAERLDCNQERATNVIAQALLAAEKRGREEAAKMAEGNSAEFDFQKALAECRDSEYGFHSGRLAAAAAIRSTN